MKLRLISLLVCLVLAPAAGMAQDATPETPESPPTPTLSPDQQAVVEQANAFIAAYNKGDLKAIAAMFAADAEWVDDGGTVFSGKDAITAHFKNLFLMAKGRTLDIDVESVRPVSADVMLEKGTTTIVDPDGRNAVSGYTAVHVKKDDAWLISQFTETGSPLAGAAARQLSALEWLVGTWEDSEDGLDVKSTIEWALNGNFLTWTYRVVGAEGSETNGTEVIGWDAAAGRIRSWAFESDGSLTEKTWTQDGPRWLIQSRTALPDGGQGTEQQTLTMIEKGKFTWSSASRQVDGEALPNIGPVTVVRSK